MLHFYVYKLFRTVSWALIFVRFFFSSRTKMIHTGKCVFVYEKVVYLHICACIKVVDTVLVWKKQVIWGPQKLWSSHGLFRTFPASYLWKDGTKTKWRMTHSLLAELSINVVAVMQGRSKNICLSASRTSVINNPVLQIQCSTGGAQLWNG